MNKQSQINEQMSSESERPRPAKREWGEVFQALGHPTLILDPQHRILAANRAAVELMGLPEAEILSRKCFDLLHRTPRPPACCPLETMLASGKMEANEMEMETVSGTYLVSCTPVFDDDGRLDQVIHIATDISELKRTEEALRRSLEGTAHSQRLLLALSQAAQAVQRAHTPEEVYQTIGDEITGLGYDATIFTVTADRTDLIIAYMTLKSAVLRLGEKLTGLSAHNYRVPLTPGGFYERIVSEGNTVFSDPGAEPIVEALPQRARPLAGRLAAILGLGQAIYAPLQVKGQTHSILTVLGTDLSEADVPAVTTFASQAAIAIENAYLYQAAQREIAERRRVEEERTRLLAQIQEQAQRMQQIVDTVPEGVLLLDSDGRIVLANPRGEQDLVVLAGAEVGDTLTRLGDRPLIELLTSPPEGLWHKVSADRRSFQAIARSIETGPTPGGWVLVMRDVTRQQEIQQRAQQQDRLAAVGQLAAGIAHDFNNIMATIVLYAQMVSRAQGLSTRDQERMETIKQQADNATSLIRQILDFGRRGVLERHPTDLLVLLKEQVKLLKHTLPESIEIDLTCGRDEYTVDADPTRLQQVIMNLAVNARDAMADGGRLQIGLERVRDDDRKRALLPEIEAGEWVRLTVRDTGAGIPPDVLPHIFEPFFTTKPSGEGTGLGLAQVHGIVAQHDGHVDVESRPGHGTAFNIYLPALGAHSPEAADLRQPDLPLGQGETILVVEDDGTTRQALVESLELLGYQVLEATNGREALATLDQRRDSIALVLSDVVMPGMGGIAMLHNLRERGMDVGVVLMTGHSMEKEIENLGAGKAASLLVNWLPKPPSLEQLAEVVAQGLGALRS
jgi:PAS domain S-box-containing protein